MSEQSERMEITSTDLLVPLDSTDALADLERTCREKEGKVEPTNGQPFHQLFYDVLIYEARQRKGS